MNGQPDHGVLLGQPKAVLPDIRVYPAVQVDIDAGGMGIGDATHHLRVQLPFQGRELRIPLNHRSLTALRQMCNRHLADGADNSQSQEG